MYEMIDKLWKTMNRRSRRKSLSFHQLNELIKFKGEDKREHKNDSRDWSKSLIEILEDERKHRLTQ